MDKVTLDVVDTWSMVYISKSLIGMHDLMRPTEILGLLHPLDYQAGRNYAILAKGVTRLPPKTLSTISSLGTLPATLGCPPPNSIGRR